MCPWISSVPWSLAREMAFGSPVSPSTEAHAGAVGIGVELAASQAATETLWLLGSRWLCPKCWLGAVGLPWAPGDGSQVLPFTS